MKKILKIGLFILIIIWIGFEVVNYSEYIAKKNDWERSQSEENISWGGVYRPIFTQGFYKLFPSLNPDGMMIYKPVIYLYPIITEKIQVKLDYEGTIVADYPTYDFNQKGWNVTAFPNGKIIDFDGKEYSYLFWEGQPSTNTNYDLSTGFIIKGEDTIKFLQEKLIRLGLTPKEYNEFIVFWYPKMKDNKYNLIHFAGDEYTKTAPLTITPKPDSTLRVFMIFKPLDKEIIIKPQEINPFIRSGFTVVEWGGTQVD